MALLKRTIKIEWKLNPSYFSVINKEFLHMPVKRIGSTITAVNRMLTEDEMMRAFMPNILGIDPTNPNANWTKEVSDYWHSLSQDVPERGLTLDTSLRFDIMDGHSIRKRYIQDLLKLDSSIKTSEDLMKAVINPDSKHKVEERLLYRYAEAVEPVDYLLWYYCLGYRSVANDLSSVNKSSKIDFYMYNQEDKQKAKKDSTKRVIRATEIYVELSKTPEKLRDVLCILEPENVKNTLKLELEDVTINVHEFLMKSPERFISIAEDKNLSLRAKIEKYIATNVFKRMSHTKTIVDGIDNTKLIGHTVDEAILYMKSEEPDRKKYLSEVEFRYKDITK